MLPRQTRLDNCHSPESLKAVAAGASNSSQSHSTFQYAASQLVVSIDTLASYAGPTSSKGKYWSSIGTVVLALDVQIDDLCIFIPAGGGRRKQTISANPDLSYSELLA